MAGGLLLLAFQGAASESFRVTRAFTAAVDSGTLEAVSVSLGYNDGLAIALPEDGTFIKALEIEIKPPENVIDFPGSMAYALYGGVSQAPGGRGIDFSGDEILMEVLPSRLSFVLQVPLREGHGLKSDPYTAVLAEVPPAESFPLFLRLFPVMKGLPDSFEAASFSVRVRPILSDEGGFRLSVVYPEQAAPASASVRIDEMPVSDPEKMLLLVAGEHHIAVSADKCRTEVRTFIVERAKITEMTIEMKDAAPTVSFAAPDNVEISLDGKPVSDPRGALKIEPGRHTVMFSVGDYSLQRQFSAEEGRDYTVSMTMDAEVIELR